MRPTARSQFVSLRNATCIVLALLLLAPGCVRRRLLIRSNPPGATVYVDNQHIGTTPCATNFIYYGTREIRLVKAGFETLTVNQPIPAPWYQIPPFDFVSENLFPRKIQDYRTLSYDMVPQVIVPTEQLLGRAEQLRQSSLQGAVLPPGTTGMPTSGPPVFPSPGTPGTGPRISPGSNTGVETIAPPNNSILPRGTGQLPPGGQPMEPLPAPSN